MEQVGLVLEGGGMRGLYTAGILDYFMERELYFPYAIGVSAGACNALSYISRQKLRSRDININFANDPRYINYMNIFKRKSIFNMDFIFDDIPKRLVPFDYQAFNNAREELVIPVTNCRTGKAVYFKKSESGDLLEAAKASSSLPFIGDMIELEGKLLLDGGIVDPIPILKSINDGNHRNVIILTRHRQYRKTPFKAKILAKIVYSGYEKLVRAIEERHIIYNMTLKYIEDLEEEGKVFVIRPKKPVQINRIERRPNKLQELYEEGYRDAEDNYEALIQWLDIK